MPDGRLDRAQARFEQTTAGRAAISVFAVVTLAAILITFLPGGSALGERLTPRSQPYLNALGLDQNWGVFAPNPRSEVLDFYAEVRFENGERATWTQPGGDPIVGSLRYYRWRKFAEFVTSDEYQQYWKPTAALIARDMTSAGRRPVEVTLVRRTRPVGAPGEEYFAAPWTENEFFVYSPGAKSDGTGGQFR